MTKFKVPVRRMNIVLTVKMYEKLRLMAFNERTSMSALIRRILETLYGKTV